MRLLLVEDDEMIGKAVLQGLVRAGFSVDWVRDGREAELCAGSGVYHTLVLDLGLPGKDGLEVLRSVRAGNNHVPVLIITARDALDERIAGLNAGADDYLAKPFHLDELVARLRALIRRHAGSGRPELVHGALVLDPAAKTVTRGGEPIALSAREFAILEVLMRRPGTVLSCKALEEAVYGWDTEVGSNAVEVHLHHLRKKLGPDAIQNVRGVGYRMKDL